MNRISKKTIIPILIGPVLTFLLVACTNRNYFCKNKVASTPTTVESIRSLSKFTPYCYYGEVTSIEKIPGYAGMDENICLITKSILRAVYDFSSFKKDDGLYEDKENPGVVCVKLPELHYEIIDCPSAHEYFVGNPSDEEDKRLKDQNKDKIKASALSPEKDFRKNADESCKKQVKSLLLKLGYKDVVFVNQE